MLYLAMWLVRYNLPLLLGIGSNEQRASWRISLDVYRETWRWHLSSESRNLRSIPRVCEFDET
jgi:hypothetical protein